MNTSISQPEFDADLFDYHVSTATELLEWTQVHGWRLIPGQREDAIARAHVHATLALAIATREGSDTHVIEDTTTPETRGE